MVSKFLGQYVTYAKAKLYVDTHIDISYLPLSMIAEAKRFATNENKRGLKVHPCFTPSLVHTKYSVMSLLFRTQLFTEMN